MEPLLVFAVPLALLWVLFIYPQQRRVREHQRVVASLREGDEVVLSAGIRGRITTLGDDELTLEVAPGVELRVARQAVLRHAGAGNGEAPGAGDGKTDELGDEATDPAALGGGAPAGDGQPPPDRGGPR